MENLRQNPPHSSSPSSPAAAPAAPKDASLGFKPLSQGLGFHPFSEGLPYAPSQTPQSPKAPAQKSPQDTPTTGTGAVAAGRPQFVFPATAAKAAAPVLEISLGWDYVARRFFAFLIDSVLNMALGFSALVASLWSEELSLRFFLNPGIFSITLGFLFFFNWSLATAQEVAFGSTLGKKFMGLKLEGRSTKILLRAVLFIPGLVLLGVGPLWSLVDSHHRGLHDLITGIQPEEI